MLSGTLAHNRWQDLSGLVAFVSNIPSPDHETFLRMFATPPQPGTSGDMDIERIRLLQSLHSRTTQQRSGVSRLQEILLRV